jgi:hypothetical protein
VAVCGDAEDSSVPLLLDPSCVATLLTSIRLIIIIIRLLQLFVNLFAFCYELLKALDCASFQRLDGKKITILVPIAARFHPQVMVSSLILLFFLIVCLRIHFVLLFTSVIDLLN